MNRLYKTAEGERLVRERYLAFLKHWPVAHHQIRIPTRQGETFIVVCGAEGAPPLLLLHGGAGKLRHVDETIFVQVDVRSVNYG